MRPDQRPIGPRSLTPLLAVLILAIAFPAFAKADSIAFVRGGDVWLATGDLARDYRVTYTGGYSDVTQADDGTIVALHGVRLHRLSRTGEVLSDFDTPVSDTREAPAKTFYGPYEPQISPDGQRVAYSWFYLTQSQNSTCFPPTCVTTINEGGTGYSHPDRQTAWDEAGYRKHSGWLHTAWADSATAVLSNPTHMPNADVVVDQPATREQAFMVQNWFSDAVDGNPHMGAGDVSRDKAKLVYLTGNDDSTLTVYRESAFPTAFKDGTADPSTRPDVCYRYSGPNGGRFSSPTFSPDGARVAVAEADGIHVVAVPSLTAGCTLTGASETTGPAVLPGGSTPDWGPADVPAARPDPTAGAKGSGGASSTNARITARRVRLGAALRRGLRVTVTGARPGRVRLSARQGRAVVATGTGTASASGRAVVVLRFTRAARARLARKRTVTLKVSAPHAGTLALTLSR